MGAARRRPDDRQGATLVTNIRRFLTGIGAPGGLERPGEDRLGDGALPSATPLVDRGAPDLLGRSTAPTAPSPRPGGVWYDVNGWLTWALAELDGVVPSARELAWDEYTRNTLAAHADAFPDHWNGTISVDDACNALVLERPSRCGIGARSATTGQITEQPTWMVMNAMRLAGRQADARRLPIDPHLRGRFSLRFAARRRGARAGRAARLRDARRGASGCSLRVRVPAGAASA